MKADRLAPPKTKVRSPAADGDRGRLCFDRLACGNDDGNRTSFAALAQNGQRIDFAERRLRPTQRQSLGNAQARAVKQRKHGGVAGDDPRAPALRLIRLTPVLAPSRRATLWATRELSLGCEPSQKRRFAPDLRVPDNAQTTAAPQFAARVSATRRPPCAARPGKRANRRAAAVKVASPVEVSVRREKIPRNCRRSRA